MKKYLYFTCLLQTPTKLTLQAYACSKKNKIYITDFTKYASFNNGSFSWYKIWNNCTITIILNKSTFCIILILFEEQFWTCLFQGNELWHYRRFLFWWFHESQYYCCTLLKMFHHICVSFLISVVRCWCLFHSTWCLSWL